MPYTEKMLSDCYNHCFEFVSLPLNILFSCTKVERFPLRLPEFSKGFLEFCSSHSSPTQNSNGHHTQATGATWPYFSLAFLLPSNQNMLIYILGLWKHFSSNQTLSLKTHCSTFSYTIYPNIIKQTNKNSLHARDWFLLKIALGLLKNLKMSLLRVNNDLRSLMYASKISEQYVTKNTEFCDVIFSVKLDS